jgi:Ca2+-binding RTX toxin-like protein
VPAQRTAPLAALTLTVLAGVLVGVVPGPASAGSRVCQGEKATIVGTNGSNRLTGTDGRDVIVGLDGDDVISGLGGNDLICGGKGADVLSGGPGADRLYGGGDRQGDDVGGTYLVGDLMRGGSGNDRMVGGWDDRRGVRRMPDTYSWSDSPRGVEVDLDRSTGVATGYGTDRVTIYRRTGVLGSAHADVIVGSDDADTIQGGDGGDRISGGKGSDELMAERRDGTGTDVVRGGAGSDVIGSYAGRDRIRGDRDNDFIEAYGDAPTSVRGDAGSDQVAQTIPDSSGMASVGGSGRDVITLYGRLLQGSSPKARFHVDLRSGRTSSDQGGAGRGTIGQFEEYRFVGNVRWAFNGSPAADRVWAITGGELTAWTYGGRDWIHGSSHDDTINGGADRDTAVSGGGRDQCRYVERGSCRR